MDRRFLEKLESFLDREELCRLVPSLGITDRHSHQQKIHWEQSRGREQVLVTSTEVEVGGWGAELEDVSPQEGLFMDSEPQNLCRHSRWCPSKEEAQEGRIRNCQEDTSRLRMSGWGGAWLPQDHKQSWKHRVR